MPLAQDPVCGMTVDPATAKASVEHAGTTYYFCCDGCAQKFRAAPDLYLKPKPASPMMVMLAAPKPSAATSALPTSAAVSTSDIKSAAPAYVCPMCPEVGQSKPGPCPSCGMALEPDTPVALTKTEYTCPMHPQIVRDQPGACPICGMALELRTVTLADEENPELVAMTRRFWVGVVLTAPLLIVAMSDSLPGRSLERVASKQTLSWIEFLLATPTVLWGGWPFFVRAWQSIVNRSLNMFTLIGLGVAVAYFYSVTAKVLPGIFPESFREAGVVPVYFEAAAVITTLVLLGQVLELKARSRT